MLSLRALVSPVLALSLLAVPGDAVAQSSSPSPAAHPSSASGPEPALDSANQLPLEGTTWRLTHVRHTEMTEVSPEVAAWISMRAGALRGTGGCSRLSGRFARMGDAIRITPRATRVPGCTRQAARVEWVMVEGLRRAATFEVLPAAEPLGDRLIVRDREGSEILRFAVDDVGFLTDETWRLSSYTVDGRTVSAATGQAAVLTFDADGGSALHRSWEGNVVGSSGCNGIVGTYARQADILRLRDLEMTPAPCTRELAAQEAAMLRVLARADLRLRLPPDGLVLASTATDDRLDFVTSDPLEGSTWLLAAIPREPEAETPVTLRLELGVVSGEGPCGPYQGSYTTDGLFIRLRDIRGPGIEDCPAQARQRKLLLALERAVLLDRDQPHLRLLDAAGTLVARFRRPLGP